jgi:photosystem II stability/assembly factor-like uncharacterized protein
LGGDREGKLLAGFLVLFTAGVLGYYIWAAALPPRRSLHVRERPLTAHDQLFGIDFRSADQGWIVGTHGLILHTADGGWTWHRQFSGTSSALTAVSFSSATNGDVIGSKGILLMTADGGVNWHRKVLPTREHLLDVDMAGPNRAYIVGAFGTFVTTSDGGNTWINQVLQWKHLIPRVVEENGFLQPNLNGVAFVSPNVGWVVGEFGLILHTADGGRSWNTQRYGSDLPQLFGVAFSDPHIGWAIGQQGTVLRTIDGGKNWLAVRTETKRDLYAISLEGAQGVIVGDGVILKTTKLGVDPLQLRSPPGARWFSEVAINHGRATVVGQFGSLFHIDAATGKILGRRGGL